MPKKEVAGGYDCSKCGEHHNTDNVCAWCAFCVKKMEDYWQKAMAALLLEKGARIPDK